MKIVFIGPVVVHTQKWVDAFKNENDVYLITMHPDADKSHSWTFERIITLSVRNSFGYYLNALQLHYVIKKIKPDVINVHYASGYGTLARCAHIGRYILNVWGSDVFDFPYESKLKMRVIQKNLRSAEQIASTSKVMKKQTEKLISPKKEIIVTPFGIDTSFFRPVQKQLDKIITIGTVKNLEPKYGIDVLIRAYNEAYERGLTNSRLLIVGDGWQEAELKQLVASLPVAKKVQFIGVVPHKDVPKYLTQFDIYVALSESESFGVAVVEAESCAVPVIVSNVGGLPEVVRDGETGFVVPHGDYVAAAERILQLAGDHALREQMGVEGRKFVCDTYSWDESVRILEGLFARFVDENKH